MAQGESLRFQLCRNPLTNSSRNRKRNKRWLALRVSEIQARKKKKIEEIQPQRELNDFLSEFIATVKEKMGAIMNHHWPQRVYSELQSSLENVQYSKSIVEDREFEQTRKALDARCKLLKKRMQANRNRPFKAEAIAMAKKEFFTRVTYWEQGHPTAIFGKISVRKTI